MLKYIISMFWFFLYAIKTKVVFNEGLITGVEVGVIGVFANLKNV